MDSLGFGQAALRSDHLPGITSTEFVDCRAISKLNAPPIHSSIRNLARSALDLILPLNCVGCRKEGAILCSLCIEGLRKLERPFCDICAQPNVDDLCETSLEHPGEIDGIRAAYIFEGPLRDTMHRFKYRGWRAAAPVLGGLLADFLENHNLVAQSTSQILVPVPLHPRRLRSRGYNQSYLLARGAGKRLMLPVREDLVRRAQDSSPQMEARSREARRVNVADVFEPSTRVEGVSILLVDDVATTGSTLAACATALKKAGAASVWGVVLGRES